MSQEDVDLVRRLREPFEAADIASIFRYDAAAAAMTAAFSSVYASDFECVLIRDDVGRATYSGLEGLRAGFLDWLSPWASYRTEIEDFIDAGEGRVVVLTRDYALPNGADAEVFFMGAPIWTMRDGKVARIEFYWNRAEGLAAAGLSR